MHDRDKLEAISGGVYGWMSEHPVSMYDALSDGAERGVRKWLDENLERIADAVAARVRGELPALREAAETGGAA